MFTNLKPIVWTGLSAVIPQISWQSRYEIPRFQFRFFEEGQPLERIAPWITTEGRKTHYREAGHAPQPTLRQYHWFFISNEILSEDSKLLHFVFESIL